MKRKKVIFSFDYELFFGDQSGTVQKTLIEPTTLLLNCLDIVGAKGNFFIDYLMFREMEKLNDNRAISDLRLLKDQIHDMVRRGHRIELHLHPHWIDAKYNGDGTWNFSDFRHYSLSSLKEETIVKMFKEGAGYLNALAREVLPGYKICAFRAGGWAVQPFDKIKKGFLAAGIRVDSSVAFGAYGKNQYSYYDFRKAPDKVMWRFENDVCEELVGGQFVELPISSYSRNSLYRIINTCYRRLFKRQPSIKDGTHDRDDLNEIKTGNRVKAMMGMSNQCPLAVMFALSMHKGDLAVIINHPKDFGYEVLASIRMIAKRCMSLTYDEFVR